MSGEEFELVELDELFVGWPVAVVPRGFRPDYPPGPVRGVVARHEGEVVVRIGPDDFPVPLSSLAEQWVYRVHAVLPDALGYYATEDPDHEVIERTSTAWRSTDVDGTPLSDAEVREFGKLEHYVKASDVEDARDRSAEYRDAAQDARVEIALLQGALAEARAEVAPSHAAGRAEVFAELLSFLRARGLWWWPVRRALARHFGRAMVGGARD